ncbi:MAG: FecR domain-containing protein [Proteobacteria bacterium]|nr:FecR domain-containing protein [Pseudomonadota bacterium]
MKRRIILSAVLVIALLGAVAYSYYRQTQQEQKKDESRLQHAVVPELPPEKEPDSFVVVSINGQVKRKSDDREQWVDVHEGARLQGYESIRTGKDSSVKLSINEKSEIELSHLSEVTVGEIAEAVHRLNLVSGKIQVDYGEDAARVLKISIEESDAFVQTTAGRFDVQSTDRIVSVATTGGVVKLTAKEKTVIVGAGQTSMVLPGQSPGRAVPIPLSVMLRVAKLQRRVQVARATTVRGQTDVGARVQINNAPIRVGEDGRFKVKVPLELGKNEIVVVAEDAAGNSRTKSLPEIKVIPQPSSKVTETKIRWGK